MLINSYYSASCHPFGKLRTGFEAEGREIPRAQQVKAAWLDKIYGQSPPFTSYLWDKSKVWGISPFGRNDMPEQLLELFLSECNPTIPHRGYGYSRRSR